MKRNYVFLYKTEPEHYSNAYFAIRCVDNRFWKAFKSYIRSLDIKHIDPKSPAGGPKVLASPEKVGDKDYMLREIEKSIKLHGVKVVMLFSHHDCGAYGGFTAFHNNEEEELEFHKKELKKAQGVILKRFSKLQVETYFIDTKGVIKISD